MKSSQNDEAGKMGWPDAIQVGLNKAMLEAGASVLQNAGVANDQRLAAEVYRVMVETRNARPNERVTHESNDHFITEDDNGVVRMCEGQATPDMPRRLG